MAKIGLELRKFICPEVVFGSGARELAGQYAKNFGAKKLLIVTDRGIIRAGWAGEVEKALDRQDIKYCIFSDLTPNPKSKEIMAGAEVYRKEGCDAIVAIGGGSCIDCAKGIGIVNTNKRNILCLEGVDKIEVPGPPLVCIPTTGSAADLSQYAIVTNEYRKVKIAIISKTLVPDVTLMDPEVTVTLSPEMTAITGIDALTHAIEAYGSNVSSPITDNFALNSISLITENLLQTIKEGSDLELRAKMMLGSFYAGLAFSNAGLGLAHAMSHSLGGLLDLSHGECGAILIGHVMDFNYDIAMNRYHDIGKAMGLSLEGRLESEKKAVIIKAIRDLINTTGARRTLGAIGVKKADIVPLAANAIKDACIITNPRDVSIKDIEALYENAL